MNGVTGRMGTNQHLMRSIVAIRQQGGVTAKDGRSFTLSRFWWAGMRISCKPWRSAPV